MRRRDPHPGSRPAEVFPERSFAEGYFAGWGDTVEELVTRGVDRGELLSGASQEGDGQPGRERGLGGP